MRSDNRTSSPQRRRPDRSPAGGDEPRRATSKHLEWAGPTRRARLIAVALAVVIALGTFALVSRTWSHGAAAPKGPEPVQVKLIAEPAATTPR